MSRFPDTRVSVIQALAAADPQDRHAAAELFARAYRLPVLSAIRWRWRLADADAEDLTHDFLLTALSKGWLDRFEPSRGSFRTFLRVAADRFVANHFLSRSRQKRGGHYQRATLDDAHAVGADGDAEVERRFRAEWVRSIMSLAVERLENEAIAEDRQLHVALFRAYDLSDLPDADRPSYRTLGEQHRLGDSQVINHLAWARRRFRSHVLQVLRTLAGSEREYREDAMDLLGLEVG